MTTTKPRRATLTTCMNLIAHQIPFQCSANLRGETGAVTGTPGRLPEPHRTAGYYADRDADRIAYTVISYNTPIAWILTTGEIIIPNITYSVTTSRHQHYTRRALHRH